MASILLKNGTVLQHQKDDTVIVLKNTDILIKGNRISKIGHGVQAPQDAQVINCEGKIISPGMIDTHNHLWLTQMKARHAEQTLLEYMYSGNAQAFNFDPEDTYWGQLGGCLEAIDAGTTTVVDYAHLTYSPEHVTNALSASISSGLRCFFCYTPITRLQKWDPFTPGEFLPPWLYAQIEKLAKAQPFGNGRIQLGFGFDLWRLPREKVVELWEKVRSLGVKLLSTHYCKNHIFGLHSIPQLIQDYGLLKSDVLIAHATQASVEDRKLMKDAGVYVAVTPESEGQMALGLPLTFQGDVEISLGVDCHFLGPSDLPAQMRLALQLERQDHNQKIIDNDQYPLVNVGNSAFVYNLGTIAGARALKMESEIGSIAEGKLADLVIYDATTPSMVCAAEQDPITAIVRHSTIRDVDTVIIDGVVKKQGGNLVPVDTQTGVANTEFKPPGNVQKTMSWKAIASAIVKSREKVVARMNALNMEAGERGMIKALGVDESKLIR
ncbi:putative metal-dependent hydrolase [Xylogone sp. PMI_703]|nr:putative metal-dependent hydrolase [Xylogone sp. PMI_703]